MNSICPLLFFCCVMLPITACAPVSDSGDSHDDFPISARQKPDPFTIGDSSAGSIRPPAPAFTAFGHQPVAWLAVIDGPLLMVDRSTANPVTLTTERVHYKNGIEFIATYSSARPQKGSKHNVSLIISKAPCTNDQGAHKLSAIMFYNYRKYTGCAAAGSIADRR